VYHGTPANRRPATASSSGLLPSGNAHTSPFPRARCHARNSDTMYVARSEKRASSVDAYCIAIAER
jgi:hypothetical protein